jgi:hypothetical protein
MLTRAIISQYLVKEPPKHQYYSDTLKIAHDLQVHSKGLLPEELLKKARPNEEIKYQQWRLDRWSPKTKGYFGRVVSNFAKIRKAEDWAIVYPNDNATSKDLKEYLEKNYPNFDSIDNWVFSFLFGTIFDDPNEVIAVFPIPKEDPSNDTEMLRPFTNVFRSEQIIDFVENKFACLESDEKSLVKVGDQLVRQGLIYYFFDRDSMVKAVQVGVKEDYEFEIAANEEGEIKPTIHNFGYLPVWKVGGLIKQFGEAGFLYESFVSPAIDSWDEAIMDYSDHQVNKAMHLHPDRWEIADVPCKTCKETGKISETVSGKEYKQDCPVCHGNGSYSVRSPFNTKYIKPSTRNGVNDYTSVPTPPMGYANRPIETLDFNKKEYLADLREGLAALCMEFIMDEPEENSGVAKAMDRDPLTTIFFTVGKHVIENIYRSSIYFIAKWRYGKILTEKEINDALPTVKIPEKYDIIVSSILAERAIKAREKNLSAVIVSNLEIDYARKEFGETSPVPKIMETTYSNGGCTEEDYIISSKMYPFIQRAIAEDATFLSRSFHEKYKKLIEYAQQVIKDKNKSMMPMLPDPNKPVE